MAGMNLRVTKLYQGSPQGSIEVAFNSCAEGTRMVEELKDAPKNMKGPDELTPDELDRAMKEHGR